MMGIGFPELMVILVIIMIIFGAGKLPEIGSAFGRSIKNFKTSMKEAEAESSEEVPAEVEADAESAPVEQESTASSDPAQVKSEETASPSPAKANPVKAQAQKPSPAKAQPAAKAKVDKAAKSEEEKMIEDAINELKSKRIGTIRTPHDGLVQQGDVFTESVKRNPWGKRSDRGVRRDVL